MNEVQMFEFARRFALLSTILVFLCHCGCRPAGPPVVNVHGKVTLNDKPVPAGRIVFESADANFMSDLDSQGRYELRTYNAAGIPPGKYKVSFKPAAPNLDTPPLADAALNPPQPLDKTIPERYYDPTTSGLTADVTPEKAEFNFELTP